MIVGFEARDIFWIVTLLVLGDLDWVSVGLVIGVLDTIVNGKAFVTFEPEAFSSGLLVSGAGVVGADDGRFIVFITDDILAGIVDTIFPVFCIG
jgi:hypothetical protein